MTMRMKNTTGAVSIFFLVVSFILVLALTNSASLALAQAKKGPLRLAWTSWIEDEAGMQVAKYILENKMGYKVEPILAEMGVISAGLKKGDIDVFLELCLPEVHKDYWSIVAQDTVIAGTFYHPTTQAWAIPDYIPKDKLNTIDDLKKPEVREKTGGKIIGIEPGAGLMRRSKNMIELYGLGYELVEGSEPAMLAALSRATKNRDWIVVTLWVPHFAYAQWPLRNLVETKEIIVGALDSCHVITRKGLGTEYPDVFRFLSRFNWNVSELNKIIYQTGVEKKPVEKAAKEFVESNPDLVHYWITGEYKK
jgi:glycine betaine/proline transport system substrate-binding protein